MTLFGFSGRIRRLEFFGLAILLAIVALACGFLALFIVPTRRWHFVVYAVYAVASWGAATLTVKRLHDIGWHGAHAIWIIPVQMVATALRDDGTPIAIMFALVALGTALWLLLTPGEDEANEFGPVPDSGYPAW